MVNQTTFTNDMSTLIWVLFLTFQMIAIIGPSLARWLRAPGSKSLGRPFVIGLINGFQIVAVVLMIVWQFRTPS